MCRSNVDEEFTKKAGCSLAQVPYHATVYPRFELTQTGVYRANYISKLYQLFGFGGMIDFLIQWLAPKGELCVTPKGFGRSLIIRKRESDIHNFWQIFGQGECDVPEIENPERIADLGSYVGYSTAYFLWRYPKAKLICVEPNPENVHMFQRNIGGTSRITLIEAALTESAGDVVGFNVPPGESWAGSLGDVDGHSESTIAVNAISFEEFFKEHGGAGFDIMKVDIEGAENLMVKSSDELKKCVHFLLLELHGDNAQKATIRESLKATGFAECRMSGEKLMLRNEEFSRSA